MAATGKTRTRKTRNAAQGKAPRTARPAQVAPEPPEVEEAPVDEDAITDAVWADDDESGSSDPQPLVHARNCPARKHKVGQRGSRVEEFEATRPRDGVRVVTTRCAECGEQVTNLKE